MGGPQYNQLTAWITSLCQITPTHRLPGRHSQRWRANHLERVKKVTRRACVTDVAEVASVGLWPRTSAYPSDLTDAQWELIEPLVPAPRSGGRPAVHSRRRVVDAILYVNRTGCAWRQLPHDFPPWATVFWYHQRWREDGVVDRLHDALRDRVRDASDRDPMASAGCVDAQSVKGADTVGAAVRGFDAGKKVNGRKAPRSWSTRWVCCCWW